MAFLKALTIAGSDSGAGAGVQADLKTFAALGVYGTSAITAVTAQNTQKVEALTCLPASLVNLQIRAVLSDIGAQAIKTGMLGSPQIVRAVASTLSDYSHIPLVVDPVLAAESGATLAEGGSLDVLRQRLLPLARVVTPNLPEAAALVGRRLQGESDYLRATREIHDMGPRFVVLKGGHRPQPESGPGGRREVVDLVYDGRELHRVKGPYLRGGPKHGTGCTFSAAITAALAKGISELEAVRSAREYLSRAWLSSCKVGRGASPLHHFYSSWPASGKG